MGTAKLVPLLLLSFNLGCKFLVRSSPARYGYCSDDEVLKAHIRKACAYDIKRSISADPIEHNGIVYNSFAELEDFFKKNLHTGSQPEPEELSQLPVLSRHRPPPKYDEALQKQQQTTTHEPSQNSGTTPSSQQTGSNFPLVDKPAVKLYFPVGDSGNTYREESYASQVYINSEQVEAVELVRSIGKSESESKLEVNPVELQQPPKGDLMYRLRRDAGLQARFHNFVVGCCNNVLGCNARNWALFARDEDLCR